VSNLIILQELPTDLNDEYCFTTRLQHDLFSMKTKQKPSSSALSGSTYNSGTRSEMLTQLFNYKNRRLEYGTDDLKVFILIFNFFFVNFNYLKPKCNM
jgi:hypothetical protein